jgi:hypothetical protein
MRRVINQDGLHSEDSRVRVHDSDRSSRVVIVHYANWHHQATGISNGRTNIRSLVNQGSARSFLGLDLSRLTDSLTDRFLS